jgi:predicted HNH restriction endonuclease
MPYFQQPVQQFIDVAMRETTILPKMQHAHSCGSIAYISDMTQRVLPNPYYVVEETVFYATQEKLALKARSMTDSALQSAIARQPQGGSQKVNVMTSAYARNQYVAEFVKRQAAGVCQDCHEPAPFISKHTGEPYLEPHHIVPLSKGGDDCVENMVALCPNCHRKRHYG